MEAFGSSSEVMMCILWSCRWSGGSGNRGGTLGAGCLLFGCLVVMGVGLLVPRGDLCRVLEFRRCWVLLLFVMAGLRWCRGNVCSFICFFDVIVLSGEKGR